MKEKRGLNDADGDGACPKAKRSRPSALTVARSILHAKEMSLSGKQVAETSKDTDDRKAGRSRNILHIRLPPRKTLSEVQHDTNNSQNKIVPKQGNANPSKNLITEAARGETSSNSPREGLCNVANSNNSSMTMSGLFEGTNNILSKALHVSDEELPEEPMNSAPSMDLIPTEVQSQENNNTPSKNLRTTGVQSEEANNNSQIKTLLGLFEVANNILSKALDVPDDELPEEPMNNAPSMNLITTEVHSEENNNTKSKSLRTTGVQSEEANINSQIKTLFGLFEEANNILSKALHVQDDELPEEPMNNAPSMNLITTEVQSEENNNSPSNNLRTTGVQSEEEDNSRGKRLLCDSDSNAPSKVVHEEAKSNMPSRNLTTTSLKCDEGFEQANNHIPTKNLITTGGQSEEESNETPSKRLTTTGVQAEEENNKTSSNLTTTGVQGDDENDNSPRRRLLCDTDSNTSKVVHEEAKNTIPGRNVTTTAVKCEEVFGKAKNHIPTKRLSDEAKSNAPSNKPTDPANKNTPRKKLRASAVQATNTSNRTSPMKLSTSVVKAVERSTNSANLKAIREYQEFKQKVKRTVYLDNLSHQATEAVINSALGQFGTLRKVSFVVNYTIPYDIPQSALVEMETEKDAESVVNMLREFPFMMSGMPRPVRAKHATAEMFDDRPRRPGWNLEFRWVAPKDPNYEMVKKLKPMSRRHEVENLALVEYQLEEEKWLAAQQRELLNCNHRMLETVDSVILSGLVDHMSRIYSINWNQLL